MKKTILILGGAGYIGSHSAYLLYKRGYEVLIIDKLIHGQNFDHKWATVIKADFADEKVLNQIFDKYKIDAVMHFAAFIEVGISVKKPANFYENNVIKTINFLDFMLSRGVKKFIFSSSCAIYGNPIKVPMNEKHPFDPISPYGKNKLVIEFVLQDYAKAYDLKYVSLRYFNAAGADPENNLGEQHNPETHIIPLMLRAIKNNKTFKIFGTDYNTPDGTCVRDYIHVLDLALAHILGLEYLNSGGKSDYFNLGTGKGYSVKEMINMAQNVVGKKMNIQVCERRLGDVDTLIADNKKIKAILGWIPKYSDLNNILNTAFLWENINYEGVGIHLDK
ncbi:UDP-glucose 4-epimerase GalE [Candidatus Dependentiae bacterium]|nr:UDP-glucose 4-epimerase GalE [Candidatus Dependentiae bacterium]